RRSDSSDRAGVGLKPGHPPHTAELRGTILSLVSSHLRRYRRNSTHAGNDTAHYSGAASRRLIAGMAVQHGLGLWSERAAWHRAGGHFDPCADWSNLTFFQGTAAARPHEGRGIG